MTADRARPRGSESEILRIKRLQKQGKRIVFTNGCFDLVHAGHVRLLRQAKSLGDILVVGLNSDASVRRLKGKGRPILSLEERSELILSLKPVDFVLSFPEDTPLDLIQKIRPDVLVKGGDWTPSKMAGADVVSQGGGKVVSGLFIRGKSTTRLLQKIRRSRPGRG